MKYLNNRNLLVTSILFLLICHQSNSQQASEIKIPTIPFPLHWEVVPVRASFLDSKLVIEAGAKTDMFRDPNVTYNTDNAPKLLFTPDEDFILTVGIEHSFTEKWDGGAVVLKVDGLNWVKFCYEKDYTGARRVVSVVTKGISDDCNSVALEGNKVFYKVAKAGPVITLYYSMDQTNWFLVRHFQFEKSTGLKVGFLAQSPVGERCTVIFSDIRYEHKKIKDPYLGE